MKLYLSSYFLGNHPEELAKLVGSNKKVGIIMNAADIYGNEKRPAYLANEIEKMKSIRQIAAQHSIDFEEPVKEFRLINNLMPPLLRYTTIRTYPLAK